MQGPRIILHEYQDIPLPKNDTNNFFFKNGCCCKYVSTEYTN